VSRTPGCSPPSAAGPLEPYGSRVLLRPRTAPLETSPFLRALLERIASSCAAAGATLIGHIKCVLHTDAGRLAANLTSVHSGASTRGGGAQTIEPGCEARLDLVVLVYGLPVDVVDGLVSEALDRLLSPADVAWIKRVPAHS
jgi:hypothetical protein